MGHDRVWAVPVAKPDCYTVPEKAKPFCGTRNSKNPNTLLSWEAINLTITSPDRGNKLSKFQRVRASVDQGKSPVIIHQLTGTRNSARSNQKRDLTSCSMLMS
jgi:hypothetical protein